MAHQINIRVPESLREDARKAAAAEGISVNQFCALAIARAVGEWQARRFFETRGGGLSPQDAQRRLGALLDQVKE